MLCLVALIFFTYGTTSCLENKISQGKNTTIENHPYQLSFGFSGKHLCGAALIKPNVAITAAHCTRNSKGKNGTIRAGTTLLETGGKLVQVQKICQHPNYIPPDYDVSVLLLDSQFLLGDTIRTIPLQTKNTETPTGALGIITGWGKTSLNETSFSRVLQSAEVPKVSQEDCEEIYVITDRMRCYGNLNGGAGICNGDSGGPLVVDGNLVGLISWGSSCGQRNVLGMYTHLANEEISKHIESCLKEFENLI